MALASTQLPTELITRNMPAGKGQPAYMAANLIYESLPREYVGFDVSLLYGTPRSPTGVVFYPRVLPPHMQLLE
jgi:hypothetical protein